MGTGAGWGYSHTPSPRATTGGGLAPGGSGESGGVSGAGRGL